MSSSRLFVLVVLLILTVAVLLAERFEVLPTMLPPMSSATACADGDPITDAGEAAAPRQTLASAGVPIVGGIIPAGPAGDKLEWALMMFNAGFEGANEASIAAEFAPAVLERMPAGALLDSVRQAGLGVAPLGLVGFAAPPSANEIRAIVRNTDDQFMEIFVTTEPVAPFRVYDLVIRPWAPSAPAPVSTAPAAPPVPPAPPVTPPPVAAGSGAPAAAGSGAPANP